MRSIWTGSIAFGLVNIPIKLYSAVNDTGLNLDMLDKRDHAPIKYKRVNENTGKEVPWSDIVKGYDLQGKYVVLEDHDFESASPEKTKQIHLELFTRTEQIDVILYDKAYYVAAAKGGERAFGLLEKALKKTGMAGIGTFVLRNKERPIVLRSAQNVLILHTLRFLREIKDPSSYIIKEQKTPKNELDMATGLIKSLEGDFNISQFKDAYTAKLIKLIKAKGSGKKLPEKVKTSVQKPETDLLAQLKKSLEIHKSGTASRATKKALKQKGAPNKTVKKASSKKKVPKKTPSSKGK